METQRNDMVKDKIVAALELAVRAAVILKIVVLAQSLLEIASALRAAMAGRRVDPAKIRAKDLVWTRRFRKAKRSGMMRRGA